MPRNCLSVFDHFVRLALKGLTISDRRISHVGFTHFWILSSSEKKKVIKMKGIPFTNCAKHLTYLLKCFNFGSSIVAKISWKNWKRRWFNVLVRFYRISRKYMKILSHDKEYLGKLLNNKINRITSSTL